MEFDPVSPPDETIRQAAEERHTRLTKPLGALGRLEELGTWLAACQGQCPPRSLQRPRVVVFAGDHGVAAKGVSAYPSEVTAQMVANFQAGGAAINVLAGIAGATVRVVDMAVAADTSADTHKIRNSSGSIDHEDALTADEVEAALAAGKAIADEEVDAGADLLVAGDMGIGNTTPAAVLIAAITGSEPVAVVGRGTGIDDQTWMRKTKAIRDALRRTKPVTADPVALLRTTAGADITAMAAFLAQAAVRRTPVILDGVVSGAAALLAEELAPGARAWWVAGHRSTEPAHTLVLDHLDLKPLLELNMRLGEGSGATAAIPLLAMAAQILTDMATFEDAGVSNRSADADHESADAEQEEAAPTTHDPDAAATPQATTTPAQTPEPSPEAEAEADMAAEPNPDPALGTGTTTTAAATETQPEPTNQTQPEPEATPEPRAETTTDPSPGADPAAATETGTEATATGAGTKTGPGTTATGASTATGTKTAATGTGTDTQPEPGLTPDTNPEPAAGTEAEAAPQTTPKTATANGSEASAATQPSAGPTSATND